MRLLFQIDDGNTRKPSFWEIKQIPKLWVDSVEKIATAFDNIKQAKLALYKFIITHYHKLSYSFKNCIGMCLPIVTLRKAAPNVELKEKLNDLNSALGRVFNEYILLASTCNTTMKIFAELKLMQPGKFGYICDKLTLLPQSNHDLLRLNETLLQPEYAATFRSQLLDARSHEMSKILTIPAENLATSVENYFCCVNTTQHPDTEALLFVGLSMAELKILLNPPKNNEFSDYIYQPSLVIFQELLSLGKKAHEVQPTFLQMLKMVFLDADLEGLSFRR